MPFAGRFSARSSPRRGATYHARHGSCACESVDGWRGARPLDQILLASAGPADPGHGGGAMVRTVADRAFLPAKSLFEQVGNMMILTGKTMTATVRPPYPYGGEFVSQFLFALQLTWFPMMISTIAFGFGAPGLQAANFLTLFGALDRLGGFFILASIREFAPLRDRGGRRRRRRHRDHRRPRGAQDPRGARRAAGARRRPDQEPRRPALSRPDADHRPARHLRADLRDHRRRSSPSFSTALRWAASSRRCSPTPR